MRVGKGRTLESKKGIMEDRSINERPRIQKVMRYPRPGGFGPLPKNESLYKASNEPNGGNEEVYGDATSIF